MDVDAPRHTGVRHLGRHQRARRLRREEQPEPGGLGGGGHGRQLTGVLEVGPQVLGRVVDREQRRRRRRGRPEPVPVLGLLPREQPRVGRRSSAQQVVAQPQVVAALDPDADREQRRVPPRGVVPHPPRPVHLATTHERRQVSERHVALQTALHGEDAVPRQARERDPGHGDTLTPTTDAPTGDRARTATSPLRVPNRRTRRRLCAIRRVADPHRTIVPLTVIPPPAPPHAIVPGRAVRGAEQPWPL